MSWKSPGGPVTGYVIYYQSEGRYNSSVHVSGGETESHSLDCLERGVTYYISIVALSDHLPSPLVGPVTVTTGISVLRDCHACMASFTVFNGTIDILACDVIVTPSTMTSIPATNSGMNTIESSGSGMKFSRDGLN